MTQRIIPVDPFVLTIFGASGDLSTRKLLPALFQRDLDGQMPPEARILGVSRSDLGADGFRAMTADAIAGEANGHPEREEAVARFLDRLDYLKLDVGAAKDWDALAARLGALDPSLTPIYYLSVAPALFGPIIAELNRVGLAERGRLVVEKPIGHDGESARALNAMIAAAFPERRVYRIDHYLGKETVQNLMALRFANALFEPLWNARYIDHVQITASEAIGVGARTDYYDHAGAIRDMVQNHLLQLLCLTAMEPPYAYSADAIRDEKLKVLRSLAPLEGEKALTETVRGQYLSAGDKRGYLEELGRDSRTETFVAIRAQIANTRWAGAPFYLRTGKRLRSRLTEIFVRFRGVAHSIFAGIPTPEPNALLIRLQPNEGVEFSIMTKDPGPGGFRLRRTPLDMSFSRGLGLEWRMPDAYERLIMDVARGDQTLFMRRDEVEAAWDWIDPIAEAWAASEERPEGYDSGGSGPSGALALTSRDHVRWRQIATETP